MVLITGGLSRTAALCCHRPKHTPASLQITVYLYTSLLPSYTPPPPSLSSFFPPCVRATFAIFLLTSGLDTFDSVFRSLSGGGKRRERKRERLDGTSTTTKNRMDRGNEISYSLVSANWCGEAGLRWRVIGERIFRARDSVDSSVKYKNDTEGGSKKDIPMKRFLFFFSFLFLSFFLYSNVSILSLIWKKVIASYFPRTWEFFRG